MPNDLCIFINKNKRRKDPLLFYDWQYNVTLSKIICILAYHIEIPMFKACKQSRLCVCRCTKITYPWISNVCIWYVSGDVTNIYDVTIYLVTVRVIVGNDYPNSFKLIRRKMAKNWSSWIHATDFWLVRSEPHP